MVQGFVLPAGLIGRFAIVKLWPELKTAEDECIARLKIAASTLGLECVEIHANGRLLENPDKIITKQDVDFVLHLHYDTPKLYDAFSFVALWNPLQFYHEWGYSRTSRNLLSHDDFISCSSPAADDHVGRLIRKAATHLPPLFNLYHSIADIVHPPSLGDHKLFYAGINWDVLRGGVSRHQELLKNLDKTGNLRIFGPSLFQGVKVWAGYDSYVREIPFDGISMINEISKAGIALVLSSQAHKESELMSNRLFESVAAGALVICDENNFAKKFFGDSLLYIDSRCPVDKICSDIKNHLAWAKNNPDQALAMVEKAQNIFRQKFALNKNLSDLYYGFSDRKLDLLKRQIPESGTRINVRLYLLLPEYSEAILNAHIASVVAQEYKNFSPVLVIDKTAIGNYRSSIENTLAKSPVPIDVLEIDFFAYGINKEIKTRHKIGEVIAAVLKVTSRADAVVFVAPNEKIFSNHLLVLAGSLIRNPGANCAATAAILKHTNQPIHGVHERIDFCELSLAYPIGYARFIFRVSALPNDLSLALPYLDRKAMAVLVGDNTITQEIPSTVMIEVANEFPSGLWDEGKENELISSFCPSVFTLSTGHEIILPQPAAPQPLAVYMVDKIIKRLNRNWILAQISSLRRDGLSARIDVLKRKLKAKLI
jgi:hypothetical protein